MSKRFCTSCRQDKPEEGGREQKTAQGLIRWLCGGCIALIGARSKACGSKARPGPKPKSRQEIEVPSEYEDQQYARQALGL